MIKTLIFDLGGVIVPLDFPRGYATIAQHCRYPPDEIRARISQTDLVARFEAGKVSPGDFHLQFCELLSLGLSYEQFGDVWSSIFPPYTLIPDEFIAGLKERYFLLLLSNTNAIHFQMIRQTYPILDHFHSFVLSYEVGALKPEVPMYREALARAGCRPDECFYTDDVLPYVEAAREQGIDAVQFVSFERLQEELSCRGVRAA